MIEDTTKQPMEGILEFEGLLQWRPPGVIKVRLGSGVFANAQTEMGQVDANDSECESETQSFWINYWC